MPDAHRTRLSAVGLALLGFALFAVTDALVKHLTAAYALPQVMFFNAAFALVPILTLAALRGGISALRTRRPTLHVVRGFCGLGIAYGAFFAFSIMPMADVYAILFAAPLIIAVLSALFFNEHLDRGRWIAVGIGFAGVLVMLRPSGEGLVNIGAMGAMAGAVSYSLSGLLIRNYGRQESAASFPFYGNLVILSVMALILPFVWRVPSLPDVALMACSGLVGGTALICLLNAFRLAPAPVVAPFQYTQIVWGVLIGFLAFGDVPDATLVVGATVVIGSGLYLLNRERRRVPAREA